MTCLTKTQIDQYLDGSRLPEWEEHLAGCAECTMMLATRVACREEVSASLIERTIDGVMRSRQERKQSSARRYLPYALAAGIAAALLTTVPLLNRGERTPVATAPRDSVVAQERPAESPSRDAPRAREESPAPTPDRANPPEVIRLGAKTGILRDPTSQVTVREHTDTTAGVVVAAGSALFAVEKNSYRAFVVTTPHARVAVTGTVFAVDVSAGSTRVDVLEGSVRVNSPHRAGEVGLAAGRSALAAADSVVVLPPRRSDGLRRRRQELERALLAAAIVPRFSPDPAGLPNAAAADTAAIAAEFRSLLVDILVDGAGSVAAVNTFVQRHPASPYGRRALYELATTLDERGDVVAVDVYDRLAAQTVDRGMAEFALYRAAMIRLERQRDLDRGRQLLHAYRELYRNGTWASDVLFALVQSSRAPDTLVNCLDAYVREFPDASRADSCAFAGAEVCRMALKDLARAQERYELLVARYPRSRYRKDAVYWAGWCLVQRGLDDSARRYFDLHEHDFPAGSRPDGAGR